MQTTPAQPPAAEAGATAGEAVAQSKTGEAIAQAKASEALAAERALDATPSGAVLYQAARAARREVSGQLERLLNERADLARQLAGQGQPVPTGPARTGLEQRITQLDARIAELDRSLAAADAQVARAAAIPGAVDETPIRSGDENEFFIFSTIGLSIVLVVTFLRRRFGRRRRKPAEAPSEVLERLARLEQIGEATSLEVERIGEGQRFVTRLLTERPERIGAGGDAREQ